VCVKKSDRVENEVELVLRHFRLKPVIDGTLEGDDVDVPANRLRGIRSAMVANLKGAGAKEGKAQSRRKTVKGVHTS
jgi:hypothetical protein